MRRAFASHLELENSIIQCLAGHKQQPVPPKHLYFMYAVWQAISSSLFSVALFVTAQLNRMFVPCVEPSASPGLPRELLSRRVLGNCNQNVSM